MIWLGGVAGILILVVVAGIWRLLQGPIELDRLIPYVEQAMERSSAGIGVAVAGISIGIDRDTHALDLHAANVRLTLPSGEKLASFPQMATSFSLGSMLGGRIEPTRIVVEHATLALTRDASGALSFQVGSPETAGDQFALGNALALFAPLRPGAPWSELRRIAVRDATILIDDHVTGKVWRADRAAATLERSSDGANGDLSLAVKLGGNAPELHATYRYAAATQKLDLQIAVDGLDPTALAAFAPVLAPLAQARFPVSGSAGVTFDMATGRPDGARLDLSFGEGQIATDLLASGQLPVAQGELHANYAPDAAELRLEQLRLDLHGGTILAVEGKLDGLQPPQLVSTGAPPAKLTGGLGVMVTHVPTGRVAALWPRGVSPGGRKWVAANLSEGMLDELAVQLGVTVDPETLTADFGGAHGTLRYHDLTVEYFNGLPPLKKVSGSATLSDRRLDFNVAGGALKSLKVNSGAISITDIGPGVETLTVDVDLNGGLQDALETIDAKPLHYAHDAGIDPARIGGKLDAQLHFKLPLLANLKLDAVDYGAKATLSGASYSKVAFDRPLTDGNFAFDLGHDGVHAKGSGKFDGAPATIDGNLYFHPKAGPRLRYHIGLALDDAARQRLDWDFGGRLSGPLGVDMIYTVPANSPQPQIETTLDLGAAALACDEASWKKPPQVPATAKFTVALHDETVLSIPDIAVRAPGLDGRFAVALNRDDRGIERVDIRRLAIADNDFSGVVTRRPGGGWQADIRAARLDIHRAAKHALEEDKPNTAAAPLAIEAHVAQLVLGPHREIRNVTATMLRDGGSWRTIRIDGTHANGHRVSLSLGGPAAAEKLHFQSDDLGASFALFGIADNVVGGKLTIDGTRSEIDGHHVLRAHVEGSDYRLVRAPALAQLLSLTSLDGIAAMMSGSGIPFTNLRGDVSFSHGTISLSRMIAYGGAIGVSASGWLNPGQDRTQIDGTLAPAYALNSVLGNFPVLGELLVGGEGQGVFAARFYLSGSNDNPSVTVNPLSALTPGLLRHLFDPLNIGTPPPPVQPAPPRDAAH